MTSSADSKLREPSVFDTWAKPTRCVTSTLFSPARPRFVVMMTTPFAAFDP
jgi:hypothetical protein